jgi:hypothetical protein
MLNDTVLTENVKNVVAGKPLTTAERLHYVYLRNKTRYAGAVTSFAIHLADRSLSSVVMEDGEQDRYDLFHFRDGSAIALPLFGDQTRPALVFRDCLVPKGRA